MLQLSNEVELEVKPELTKPIQKMFDISSLKPSKVQKQNNGGKTKITYTGSGIYIGRYKDNKKNGRGELVLPNNDKYIGKFNNDLFEGKGVYYWANGEKYEGDFKNGVMEGSACVTFSNGDIYEFIVSGDKLQAVHMLPGFTHSIKNLDTENELITMMWANEPFDQKHPDTFYEEV